MPVFISMIKSIYEFALKEIPLMRFRSVRGADHLRFFSH